MILHTADEAPRRRRMSTAMTAGIAISAALHAGLVVYLYQQRFDPTRLVHDDPSKPVIVDIWEPKEEEPPPPPEPPVDRITAPETPTAPPVRVRRPAPVQQPTELAPFAPYEGDVVPSNDPPVLGTQLPPGPLQPPVADPPAPVPERGPPVITRPRWISQPSPEQMARHYPDRALERETQGRAVLQCRVTASGQVTACTVAGETPSSAGFGEAALKVSRYFRMSPQTEDGRPVEGASVRVPVTFRLAD